MTPQPRPCIDRRWSVLISNGQSRRTVVVTAPNVLDAEVRALKEVGDEWRCLISRRED